MACSWGLGATILGVPESVCRVNDDMIGGIYHTHCDERMNVVLKPASNTLTQSCSMCSMTGAKVCAKAAGCVWANVCKAVQIIITPVCIH